LVGVGKPVTVKGRGLGDYMSKTTWIASVARSVCVVALFMGALPAYADTITGAYTVGGIAVQGGVNFSTTADVLGGTLVFGSGSIFSGITYSFNNQTGLCVNGRCSFGLNTIVSGDNLTYNINLNLSTDQYTASGKISKPVRHRHRVQTNAQFSSSYSGKGTDPPSVPEDWGLSDSLGLFALALLAFGVLTRLGVLRTVHP